MKKRTFCAILAAVVSVCFVVCLAITVRAVLAASDAGAPLPMGLVMLTLVTGFCAFVIWKGVREMGS